jgi:hypothetical protein
VSTKRIHCCNCGEDLGEVDARHWYPGDLENCGKPECARAMSDEYRGREQERKERAEEDNYERY